MRLMTALKTTQPESPEAFYSLMFHKVRQVLLDLAMRQTRETARRRQGPLGADGSTTAASLIGDDTTHDPRGWHSGPSFTTRSQGCLTRSGSSLTFIISRSSPRPRSPGS